MISCLSVLKILWLWWCVLSNAHVNAQVTFPTYLFTTNDSMTTAVASSNTCNASTEYYDAAALRCSQCATANGASTIQNRWLVPDNRNARTSGLAATCTCDENSIWKTRTNSTCESIWPAPCSPKLCVACPTDQVPSLDSSRCMFCGISTIGIEKSVRECKCTANSILKERSENGSFLEAKECVVCTDNTIADGSTNTCIACPDPMIVSGEKYSCMCPSDYQYVASQLMGVQKCILKTHIDLISSTATLSTAKEMTYSFFSQDGRDNSAVSFTSAVFEDMFLSVAAGCFFYQTERDIISCQALGNLCVLRHFDPATPSCILFDLIQRNGRSATINDIDGWSKTLPFLKYRSPASSVIRTPIAMTMSLDASNNDHLEFVLASYDINGTLIGFQPLTHELEYCQQTRSSVTNPPSWMRFGVDSISEYSCDLESLPTSTLMHELFLVDRSLSYGDKRYIPIPVQNLNYLDSKGVYINQDNDASNDFLSHRFFLYDIQTGLPVGGSSPKVIRYAKSITLTVKTQASDPHFIYVPLLTVAYINVQELRSVQVLFCVNYVSNIDDLWSFAKGLFIAACILAGCRVLLQTFNWYRRSLRNDLVNNAAGKVISILIFCTVSHIAPVSFGVMFIMCSYLFIIFRLQSTIIVMLPVVNNNGATEVDEYYPFRVLLTLSFFCQLASVARLVYLQAQLQLFFVDWEKPRASIVDIDSSKPTHASISVWRMVLAVNEWNKLQTVRKTSLRFTLVFLLFLLYGCKLRLLALPVPRSQMQFITLTTTATGNETDGHQLNPCLRFANVSILWLLCYMGQRLWNWIIFERYIDEPREQLFIDLCTVAKVSCFFLDETYHGFYLHCRSPHPFADGNMKELVDQLKLEEAGLTAGRYLDSTFPDCQTFEIFVTRKWKRKFSTLYASVRGENEQDRTNEGLIQRSFSSKRSATLPMNNADLKRENRNAATESMVRHAEQLRDFLQKFVENQNDRYRWRIYRAHTCLTRFLDISPDMSFSKQSLFLPDTNSKFAKASLFLGIDSELMLLDLLCFCLFDLWIGNHAVSALMTYALQLALLFARTYVSRRNIAKSTLVDSRFLI